MPAPLTNPRQQRRARIPRRPTARIAPLAHAPPLPPAVRQRHPRRPVHLSLPGCPHHRPSPFRRRQSRARMLSGSRWRAPAAARAEVKPRPSKPLTASLHAASSCRTVHARRRASTSSSSRSASAAACSSSSTRSVTRPPPGAPRRTSPPHGAGPPPAPPPPPLPGPHFAPGCPPAPGQRGSCTAPSSSPPEARVPRTHARTASTPAAP